jgi:hypothetical protein
MLGLPFREVWTIDFEFVAPPGHRPRPVCLVARELESGRLVRWWEEDLLASGPPFPIDDRTLFVAYYAPAEWSCFLQLGWPLPLRVIDLYAEFRAETNGLSLPAGRSLLGALSHHGIAAVTSEHKEKMRHAVMAGGPWTLPERVAILDYCQSDVDALGPLLERMLHGLRRFERGLGQALLRGRYTTAVARIEHAGVPIDVGTLDRIRCHWADIKLALVRSIDADYDVYEGTTFKAGRFAYYLAAHGITWPLLATGKLNLQYDTFKDLARSHPQLAPLKELRHALGEMRLEELAVGPDGRNRTLLSPFGARSGRNTPSNTRFVFGPSVWMRGLIKPEPGRALAYIDWSSQEVAIAAVLSNDRALLAAVESGDPYLAFAKMAGLAPADATKETHGALRDQCKACVLGVQYGMGARSLAIRIGVSELDARDLLRRMARTFPDFWAWSEHSVDLAQLTDHAYTVLGWPLHGARGVKSTTLKNFPMQANGAEMLRLACCLATEAGVQVVAPVHDALLIEAAADGLPDAVATTRDAMARASRTVLAGFEIATDVTTVLAPQRFSDPRGAVMWQRVMELLDDLQTAAA